MAWIKACSADDVVLGAILRRRLAGLGAIGLTRLPDGPVVAFENRCPHVGGPLALGEISGSEIVCPWHFFRFDLKTGKPAATEASVMKMRLFPVEEKDGHVFVEFNENSSTTGVALLARAERR